MRRLRVLAVLALCLMPVVAFADEKRCLDLGADCIANEPLNTNTHDGGNTNWSGQGVFNPDDSAKGGFIDLATGGGSMAPASSLGSILPSGHALQYVYRRQGGNVGSVYGKPWGSQQANSTLCTRSYRRWAVGNIPPPGSTQNQMKIMTSGGRVGADTYNPWQLSWGGHLTGVAPINMRFDGNTFMGDQSASTGNLSGFRVDQNCWNNFCRFEICLDWATDGTAHTRFLAKPVSPGSGTTYTLKRGPGLNKPTSLMLQDPVSLMGLWSSGFSQDTWNTHGMQALKRPMDPTFWIGAACEVEGGCSGTPPPQPVCGDGVKNGSEVCDGTSGCAAPNVCSANCSVCVAPPPAPICGDGVKNGTEICDGASGCPAPGVCNATCTVCAQPPPPAICGDGIKNGTEVCDGAQGCVAPNTCNGSCSACVPPPPPALPNRCQTTPSSATSRCSPDPETAGKLNCVRSELYSLVPCP